VSSAEFVVERNREWLPEAKFLVSRPSISMTNNSVTFVEVERLVGLAIYKSGVSETMMRCIKLPD
jgi:hypothetical protein